ncbi:CotH kinase family protein [Cohnella sp. JJ-181]|uniref:CotH kinase family protein n=1 Tax=Cohnella rhizoplanae TaxID=2974897 RepID=UPI0022FF6406|nr:CotH kinase family protein [Cohnella sp. JJ-181]CAI6082517.1 Inner spore coat protein H [Cohnella sp. JJ-181]
MPIPVRVLRISDRHAAELENNLWNGRFVPAAMDGGPTRPWPVSVRYRGGHTRAYPKRSYEVASQEGTRHYNAEFDDPSLIRNALSFWFLDRIGLPSPSTRHVLLVRNGARIGVYLEIEAVDADFFRRRGIRASSLFYAVNDRADFRAAPGKGLLDGYEYRFGGRTGREQLRSFIAGLHRRRSAAETAAYIEKHIDVDNYLRWLSGAVLTGNYDGFDQNYAIYRHRPSGRWRMAPWDYEGTWGRNCFGKPVSADLVEIGGYNALTRKLLGCPPLKKRYRDLLRALLRTAFTERAIMPQAEKLHREIAPYIREERAGRGGYAEFPDELGTIRQYIRDRREVLIRDIKRL